ncbi:ribokinase [Drosophila teissieri]|uniref:ribokinase n=1 Tax=Drosophila teissieri TaxID=7243 RepID=UPI001CBA289D|nr:ribokinase [Drosophila teissieri]
MGKSVDVVVFGTANIDYITYVPELPKPGELVAGTYMETSFGGKAANQCVAAAKLGASTVLVAKLGKDQSGDDYLNHLQQHEVDVTHVQQVENNPTGMSEIAVSEEGEQYKINVAGANAFLTAKDVSRAKKSFQDAKVLLCQLETDMNATMCALRQFKGVSLLHMSPMRKDIPKGMIGLPNILVVNQEAAAKLTDMEEVKTPDQARSAAETLIGNGAKSVIITMGEQGAVYMSKKTKDTCTHVPASEVPHLADSSGAGDAFMGSLAYYIARFPKLSTEHHISAAHSCAAYSMGRRGTQPSFPGKESARNDLCYTKPTFSVIPPSGGSSTSSSSSTSRNELEVVDKPPAPAPAPPPENPILEANQTKAVETSNEPPKPVETTDEPRKSAETAEEAPKTAVETANEPPANKA